ncbi:GTP cyclohydrolase [Gaetbulibacter aestuarii]|uniref:GTP cyclohydrolase n=1 Tax=Gaetbulibacter aestuarii TaxID=1502358 RepID=A0ABW7N121_9FLAO
MITLKEVQSKSDLKAFVKFPFKIYKDNPYWVPPIISQEMNSFNKKENPVFEDAAARLFLAYKGKEIVGRIAAIINWAEVKESKLKKMRFGWFDFVDDPEVSKTLLDEVATIGKANNLDYMEGPVGFSNLDKVGVMTEGFESKSTMVTWYNAAYYQKHYEAYGMTIEKGYIESQFSFSNVNPDFFVKAQALIKRRYNLRALNFKKTSEVMPYVDQMFDLFNTTYAKLSSFVAISDIQKAYFKKKFISFINPEYIKFVMDDDDNMIAFAIVMPSFADALQKMKGKLFPFGFTHLLHAKKHSKNVVFYLIGVTPEFQNKGIHAIIFDEYYRTFKEKGIENCFRTPELDDNEAIHNLWKHFDPKITKRRKTYRKDLK